MEHGKQGFLVRPASAADRFAQSLLYLLERPAERARMGREGRRTAVSRYAWPLVAEKLEHLYTEFAAAKAMRSKVRR
jgi:glycosyltransferase involved in cell wall biosynthesis